MKVLVAGGRGFLGAVLGPALAEAGHEVVGVDMGMFDTVPAQRRDIRDMTPADLTGCDAVVNLAAMCNDACGDLSASATHAINHVAAAGLAHAAQIAGVRRYVLASSCSVYGLSGADAVDESMPVVPTTAYGTSKVAAENAIGGLANDAFHPTFLRFATLFGRSPSQRSDLLVNRVVSTAMLSDEIHLHGDGRVWRPLLHVRDAAAAICAILSADEMTLYHGQIYNVGATERNYQVVDVINLAKETFPSAKVVTSPAIDPRSYRVTFDKFTNAFPQWRPRLSIMDAFAELAEFYDANPAMARNGGWQVTDRREHLLALRGHGRLDRNFRWTDSNDVDGRSTAADLGEAGVQEPERVA
jgi:nucleoside-diphosphate-sugar epimerase